MSKRIHRNDIAVAAAAAGTFAAFFTVSRPYAAIGGVIALFALFARAPSGERERERDRTPRAVTSIAVLGIVVSVAASIHYWMNYSSDAALSGGAEVTARALSPLIPDASGYAASLRLELTSHTKEGSYFVNVAVTNGGGAVRYVSILAIDFRQGTPITREVLVLDDFKKIAAISHPQVAFTGLIKVTG